MFRTSRRNPIFLCTQGRVGTKAKLSQAMASVGCARSYQVKRKEHAAFRRIALPKHDILVHPNKGMPRPLSTDSNNAQTSVASVSCYRNSAVGTTIVCHASHLKAVDKNVKRIKKDKGKKEAERTGVRRGKVEPWYQTSLLCTFIASTWPRRRLLAVCLSRAFWVLSVRNVHTTVRSRCNARRTSTYSTGRRNLFHGVEFSRGLLWLTLWRGEPNTAGTVPAPRKIPALTTTTAIIACAAQRLRHYNLLRSSFILTKRIFSDSLKIFSDSSSKRTRFDRLSTCSLS